MWSFEIGFFHLMFSRFIQVVVCVSTSFSFLSKCYSIVCTFCFCTDRLMCSVDIFWLLQLMPLWTWVYKYILSTGRLPMSRIAGTYGNPMFNFLRNYQTVFQCDCNILPSYQSNMWAPISPHSCQRLLITIFYYCHPGRCISFLKMYFLSLHLYHHSSKQNNKS